MFSERRAVPRAAPPLQSSRCISAVPCSVSCAAIDAAYQLICIVSAVLLSAVLLQRAVIAHCEHHVWTQP